MLQVIALPKRFVIQPRNRFQCVLHINELPLRHMGHHYLGETSGPTGFKSELGKQVEHLKDPQIAAFPPIPNSEFPEVEASIAKDFSRDQSILYKACKAVSSGICSSVLATASLAPVFCHTPIPTR